jgi:hypothetical protein
MEAVRSSDTSLNFYHTLLLTSQTIVPFPQESTTGSDCELAEANPHSHTVRKIDFNRLKTMTVLVVGWRRGGRFVYYVHEECRSSLMQDISQNH